jgi:hypothetical protein
MEQPKLTAKELEFCRRHPAEHNDIVGLFMGIFHPNDDAAAGFDPERQAELAAILNRNEIRLEIYVQRR